MSTLTENDKRKKKRRQQERDRDRTNKHQRSATLDGFVKKLYSKIEKKNKGSSDTRSHSLSSKAHKNITNMITFFVERIICNEALADLLERRKGTRIRGKDIKAAFDLVLGNNENAKERVHARMEKARIKFESSKQ